MKKCMGCMRDYHEDNASCPICGYSAAQIEAELRENPEILRPETILDGRYILGRALSISDFSIVYISWDALLQKRVAVKEYFPDKLCRRNEREVYCEAEKNIAVFKSGQAAFEEEIALLNRNQDIPGIVNIFRCVRENNTSYMIMEYLEGITLQDVLDSGEYPNGISSKTVLKSVMETLETLHGRGICHYNLSPDNIYLDEEGNCRLIDFGHAKVRLEALTDLLYLFDEHYTAPEILRSVNVTATADMYSVGTIFYTMLTGKVPQESLKRFRNHRRLSVPNKKNEDMINLLADPEADRRPKSIRDFWIWRETEGGVNNG